MVSQNMVTGIIFILITQLLGTVLILSEIQVLANRAIVNFPETIDFSLRLESQALIESVTLIYGTNATSCNSNGSRQPQDFDPDRNVDLEWQWDLKRSGSLPPGSQIWWQWEIEDEDGEILTTERQSVTVVDDRHTWQEISGSNVSVNWYEGNHSFGQSLFTLATESLDRLSREAGITTPNEIHLWIYPTAADVRDAVVYTSEWTGGLAFPNYGITVIGLSPGNDEWAADVIPHELAHLVQGGAIFNCRGGRLPTWLSEGMAVFSAGGSSQSEIAKLEDQLAEGQLPPLRSLARGFSAYGGEAGLAYTQSDQAVKFLIEFYGPEMMAELLDHIKSGESIDDALLATYGVDTAGLDADWRNSQGYAPTPTSAADVAFIEATPTLIPTIALGGIPVTNTPTAPPVASETVKPTKFTTAVATATPAPPAETKTPDAVAAVNVTTTLANTRIPSSSNPVESSNISPVLVLVGAGLLILIGLVLLIRYRGG